MKIDEGLKKNHQFRKVYRHGKSVANHLVVLYVLKTNHQKRKVGYSVSKKIGNAVIRNRVKRLFKEVYRHNNDKLITGIELVFIARKNVKDASYKQIEKSFNYLFKKSNILKE